VARLLSSHNCGFLFGSRNPRVFFLYAEKTVQQLDKKVSRLEFLLANEGKEQSVPLEKIQDNVRDSIKRMGKGVFLISMGVRILTCGHKLQLSLCLSLKCIELNVSDYCSFCRKED
jgi:hypothetical protein